MEESKHSNNQQEHPVQNSEEIDRYLHNVIINSDFGIINQLQQLYDSNDANTIQNNTDFEGWDNIYQDISIKFAKILKSTFNNISKQFQKGTNAEIDKLTQRKAQYLAEIENISSRFQEMNVSESVISQSQAPLLQQIEIIETEINKWGNLKNRTDELLHVEEPVEHVQYNWDNVQQLNLRGGSGGGGGANTYTVNGIVVEATHPVLYFRPNPSYYHMGYMFNGDITTAHGASNPANHCSNAFRTSFWLTHAPANARNQQLTFTFAESIKLSYINVYSNIGSMTNAGQWAPNCMYNIDVLHDDEWEMFCEIVDTKDDKLGEKRTHQIREIVKGVRFNLIGNGYVVMKEIDFFVIT